MRRSQKIHGIEASTPRTAAEKAAQLITAVLKSVEQAKQLKNPNVRVALEDISVIKSLGDYCSSIEGLTAGDLERFVGKFWERGSQLPGWEPFIQNVDTTVFYGGRSDSIFWENGKGLLASFPTAHNFPSEFMNGKKILGKNGLRITQMRSLPITLYSGEVFGKSGATVVPDDLSHLPAIWCFCSSPEYSEAVRRIDQKLNVTNATLVKVPFDLAHWAKVAQEKYPNGLPKPSSDDPIQWLFHGHPAQSDAPLQVAVARLLGYRWPAEQDSSMELSDDARVWVKKSEALLAHADDDGIVCIPAVRGEKPAADRLRELLAAAYGQNWSPAIQEELLAAASFSGKTLENWLRDGFFDQHCKLFHQRPFIWHVWDGRRDGFSALVNYHKLDRRQLEKLTYTYLGDWIKRQEDSLARDEGGVEARLLAAHELQNKLKLILEGEPPYGIFVRWKPMEQQPIGWEPDLNDGVRLNVRPFVTADILRKRPSIKWGQDRGKNPPGSPWGEERINDRHLTLAEKTGYAIENRVRPPKGEVTSCMLYNRCR